MKSNEGMCHVLLSAEENLLVNIGTELQNIRSEKLQGIKIDSKLNNEDLCGSIFKKASLKLRLHVHES